MPELYQLPAGTDIAGDLPQVELPSIPGPPREPLRITVTAKPQPPPPLLPRAKPTPLPPTDPLDAYVPPAETALPSATPERSAPTATARPGEPATPGDPLDTYTPPEEKEKPFREVSGKEAVGRGALDALTFGFGPAIAGLAEASGMPSAAEGQPDMIDANPIRPVVGAAKLLHSYFASHPDEEVQKAYQRGREAALSSDQLAQEQNPTAFLAGQFGGTLATLPAGGGFGLVRGATVIPRIGRAMEAGAIGGGLYGTGESVSKDEGLGDIAKGAAGGALTGTALGGLGAGVAESAGSAGRRVARLVRGARDPDTEAASQIAGTLRRDFERGGGPALGPEEIAAANQAGLDRTIMDTGGQATRDLARTAGNVSSEAWDALQNATQARFRDMSPRVSGFIRRITGGPIAVDDAAALKAAAAAANKPAYERAYAATANPAITHGMSGAGAIYSPELDRLAGSPAVGKAMAGAAERGKDRAIADGFAGGFNPPVTVTQDGRVVFNKGPTGVPTYPNLQFWDYAQRELRDAANAAQRTGRNSEAEALFKIHAQLNKELDRIVPEFRAARQTAASFFHAGDALEAGQNFVMQNADVHEARRALARMSDPERQLFARGFASDLADKVMQIGDNQSLLNRIFIDSHLARQKINMALGPDVAQQLEALLRAERLTDMARTNLGNSTTARQLKQMALSGVHGAGGAGAVAAFELLNEEHMDPAHILGAALVVGSLRHGAHVIDERVARRIGEMLVSNDPSILARGIQIASKNPVVFNALRHATGAGTRVAAHDIGPTGAAAGAAAGLQYLIGRGEDKPHYPDHHDDQQSQQ